jgi:hypothetical protein
MLRSREQEDQQDLPGNREHREFRVQPDLLVQPDLQELQDRREQQVSKGYRDQQEQQDR